MIRRLLILVTTALAIVLGSCSDDDDATHVFIGDSLVSHWNLKKSFPGLATHNYGVGGSGISHLQEFAGKFTGKTAVVLTGTNDIYMLLNPAVAASYADSFVDAVAALGATRAYVISMLPRDYDGDTQPLREAVYMVNLLIRSRCIEHPSVSYINVFDYFAADGAMPDSGYFYDGLHLNDRGYALLSDLVADVIN